MALQAQGFVMAQGVEDRLDQPALRPGLVPEPVQDVLGDRRVSYDSGPLEHGEMPRNRGLRQLEHQLQVGHEQWGSLETIQDPEPGGFGENQEQLDGSEGVHMRQNIYTRSRI